MLVSTQRSITTSTTTILKWNVTGSRSTTPCCFSEEMRWALAPRWRWSLHLAFWFFWHASTLGFLEKCPCWVSRPVPSSPSSRWKSTSPTLHARNSACLSLSEERSERTISRTYRLRMNNNWWSSSWGVSSLNITAKFQLRSLANRSSTALFLANWLKDRSKTWITKVWTKRWKWISQRCRLGALSSWSPSLI